MTKLLPLLITFFVTSAGALTEAHLFMKPDQRYMSFFLVPYLEFYKKSFYRDVEKIPLKNGEAIFRDAISKIDHWLVPGHPEFEQLLLGMTFRNGRTLFKQRIFLHDDTLLRRQLPATFARKIHFVETDSEKNLCLMSPLSHAEITWPNVPKIEGESYFAHFCLEKSRWVMRRITMTSRQLSTWPDPFRGQATREVRTYSDGKLTEVSYFAKFTHVGVIPRRYHRLINLHGEKALLVFDKYSVNKDGEMTIHYP